MDLTIGIRSKAVELSGTEAGIYSTLSPLASEMILAQLPKNINLDACYESIICAGAFMVLSLAQTLSENELAGFDAGTLKLTFRDRNDSYAQIAKQLMAPWLGDQTAFCGVRT